MLDQARLEASLPIHGLGKPLYYFRSIDSTNAKALELAAVGAPHGSLVVAEEQTAGRGRAGRRWFTPSGSGIALSLLLRWDPPAGGTSGALSVFGALGVAEAAEQAGADARIKWPNDVLVGGRKVAGVLVEAQWQGSSLASAVVGIGVNVGEGSVPAPDEVDYPAGCLEQAVGRPIDPQAFLLELIRAAGRWYPKLGSLEMLEAWESRLAFRGTEVAVMDSGVRRQGRLVGLDEDGHLLLETAGGQQLVIGPTAAELRPIDSEKV
ncbi:MAG TPA: biotin--[acetyl-CoA-carboxylase] ligase [Anaerolineales bacterium]|jgi:BirA family biotin operon repressor/biotin-[acetyl-CoA-carboxylase] ligase|nr:biotin--[acetyl-CoA-carboxylase] ligase [Anaerolineales bacterium]